ncbi:hypothetical protein F4775DRAFT_588781 [Biscogniauxia sp. FL1348]|nr:hypothetical protein F4775DRAFT_588781 [Biscogniauxia sp. FL1348]
MSLISAPARKRETPRAFLLVATPPIAYVFLAVLIIPAIQSMPLDLDVWTSLSARPRLTPIELANMAPRAVAGSPRRVVGVNFVAWYAFHAALACPPGRPGEPHGRYAVLAWEDPGGATDHEDGL